MAAKPTRCTHGYVGCWGMRKDWFLRRLFRPGLAPTNRENRPKRAPRAPARTPNRRQFRTPADPPRRRPARQRSAKPQAGHEPLRRHHRHRAPCTGQAQGAVLPRPEPPRRRLAPCRCRALWCDRGAPHRARPTGPTDTQIVELDAFKGGGRTDLWSTNATYVEASPNIFILRGVSPADAGRATACGCGRPR